VSPVSRPGARFGSQLDLDRTGVNRLSRSTRDRAHSLTGICTVEPTRPQDTDRDTIYVDVAPTPHGPWTNVSALKATPLCGDCNTYFASFVASPGNPNALTIGLSNNTWDGKESGWYRPTLISITTPRTANGSPSATAF
jgi:hypothetical protein